MTKIHSYILNVVYHQNKTMILYVMIIPEVISGDRLDRLYISDNHSNIQRSQKCFGKVDACHSRQALVLTP
jgi:hypothetical protein